MIPMPIGEVADRATILMLKFERGKVSACADEAMRYMHEAHEEGVTHHELNQLVSINAEIWDLEADIRQGQEDKLGLEEVGRRALKIRDLNRERVRLKNELNAKLGQFQEQKVQHASS